jgi:DNA-binding transcriptional LysR family regulator
MFALGFLTGQEMDWLPEAMRILRDELPNIQVTVSSQYSPELAKDLVRGKLDLAFLRPEANMPDLEFRLVTKEPLVVVLQCDHRLASLAEIDPHEIVGETFINVSGTAGAARSHRCLPAARGHRDPSIRGRQSRWRCSGRIHAGVALLWPMRRVYAGRNQPALKAKHRPLIW